MFPSLLATGVFAMCFLSTFKFNLLNNIVHTASPETTNTMRANIVVRIIIH